MSGALSGAPVFQRSTRSGLASSGRPTAMRSARPAGEIALGASGVVAAGEDERSLEFLAESILDRLWHGGRAHRRVIDEVNVEQTQAVERAREISIVRLHLRIGRQIVEGTVRRQADADFFLADCRNRRRGDFEPKARPVLDRPTIRVGTLVRGWANELLDEVAVGAVQLDAIEASGHGVLGCLDILADGGLDVRFRHRFRHGVGLRPLGIGVHLARCRDRRRPKDGCARRQIVGMPDSSGVHQLHENLRTLRMDRVRHPLPARYLRGGKNAGDTRIAETVRGRRGPFGDDQPRRNRALRIILNHQIVRNIVGRAITRHRRHDKMVL